MSVMKAPRPGSSIDRAMRALQSGPLGRATLARLIEQEEEEVDGLLRYGVRIGLLVRSNGDEDVSYALGDGVPVEDRPPPAEASAAPVKRAAPEPAREASRPPAGQTALAELRQSPYQPQHGSQAAILLDYLQRHAPHGGDAWLSPAELAASGAKQFTVRASLDTAMKCGAVLSRGTPRRYQAGPNAPVVVGVIPVAAPAAAPAPAARAAAPTSETAAAVDLAAFLLKQMDSEIERLQNNLRVVRRRREDFAAAMKGRRA